LEWSEYKFLFKVRTDAFLYDLDKIDRSADSTQ
jgi:hypothetical protein